MSKYIIVKMNGDYIKINGGEYVRDCDPESERRIGEWEYRYVEDGGMFSKQRFYCSECGKWQTYGRTEYCPRCGTKMENGK